MIDTQGLAKVVTQQIVMDSPSLQLSLITGSAEWGGENNYKCEIWELFVFFIDSHRSANMSK